MTTLLTSAGASALTTNVAGSDDHGMMSIFSPCNSPTTACTRLPRMPTQAPTGSMPLSREMHRDLGAAAGIARDRFDLDDAVIDLRHLLREQLGHELRVRARQEDLRAARLLAHVVDIGAHPLALAEALARQQFVAPQHRLGAAEIDDDIAELDPLDEAVDDLADAVLELGVLPLPLGVAHLLHDDLLRGLRRDAAEIDRRQRVGDEIADLGLGVEALRRRERHLRRVVLDLVDDLAEAQQADLAAAPVDLGADVVFLAVFRAPGLLDGLLHRLQDFVLVDALVAGDRVGDLQQFGAGVGGGAFHRASVGQACVRAARPVIELSALSARRINASGRACAGPARGVRR